MDVITDFLKIIVNNMTKQYRYLLLIGISYVFVFSGKCLKAILMFT